MEDDETPRLEPVLRDERLGARAVAFPGNEYQCAIALSGLEPDAAQRVEIALYGMAGTRAGKPVVVREAGAPQPVGMRQLTGDGVSRSKESREPGTAWMLRQMHNEIEGSRGERTQQSAFGARLPP